VLTLLLRDAIYQFNSEDSKEPEAKKEPEIEMEVE